jgi:hypothetical protein
MIACEGRPAGRSPSPDAWSVRGAPPARIGAEVTVRSSATNPTCGCPSAGPLRARRPGSMRLPPLRCRRRSAAVAVLELWHRDRVPPRQGRLPPTAKRVQLPRPRGRGVPRRHDHLRRRQRCHPGHRAGGELGGDRGLRRLQTRRDVDRRRRDRALRRRDGLPARWTAWATSPEARCCSASLKGDPVQHRGRDRRRPVGPRQVIAAG